MTKQKNYCSLCDEIIGDTVWTDKNCYVIRVLNDVYGLHRVIWKHHVRELSDLEKPELDELIRNSVKLEKYLLEKFKPDKVNIASFGNQTPHLHIHVIPRWKTDPWWPDTTWSPMKEVIWKTFSVKNKEVKLGIGSWSNFFEMARLVRQKAFVEEEPLKPAKELHETEQVSRYIVLKDTQVFATGRLGPSGQISWISVLKTHRHLGFYTVLLHELEKEAYSLGLKSISVNAEDSAIDHYKKQGFLPSSKTFLQSQKTFQKMVKILIP
jgi:diadenosine tetraphosphate (Ap4A) HIT family hydrolase/GNAT superfamily N-acetyltransferase